MAKITVIIPFVGTTEADVALFTKAYESTKNQVEKVIVVGPKASLDAVRNIKGLKKNTEFLENESDTSYAYQVMLAVDKTETDWFSVLEFDDEFTSNETISYANEAFWASSFSEVIGYPDFESLSDYLNFNTSGAVFKKSDFLALGGLKTSMKLVFWYEFLLRALYKQKKFFVVPKVGYIHSTGRDDSLTEIYRKEMSEKEVEWWLELAKKEYFFPQDRHKEYEEE